MISLGSRRTHGDPHDRSLPADTVRPKAFANPRAMAGIPRLPPAPDSGLPQSSGSQPPFGPPPSRLGAPAGPRAFRSPAPPDASPSGFSGTRDFLYRPSDLQSVVEPPVAPRLGWKMGACRTPPYTSPPPRVHGFEGRPPLHPSGLRR